MPDENITVLILNSLKRVRSIKVNRSRIRFAIITAISIMSLLVISLGANYYLYKQNRDISGRLALLNSEQQSGENSPEIAGGTEDAAPNFTEDQGGSIPERLDITSGNEALDPGGDPVENIFALDMDSGKVGLEFLRHGLISRDMELEISFYISKETEIPESIAGYVSIVAKTTDENNPFLSYPSTVQEFNENGTPLSYMQGEYFSIRSRRPTDASIMLFNPAEKFIYFRIYIYSVSGDLLFVKTQEITGTGQ